MQSLAISDATAQDVINALPDSLSSEGKSVVKKACSLVGKVNYFWGGKSSAIGWDSEWGKMKLVTAEGINKYAKRDISNLHSTMKD